MKNKKGIITTALIFGGLAGLMTHFKSEYQTQRFNEALAKATPVEEGDLHSWKAHAGQTIRGALNTFHIKEYSEYIKKLEQENEIKETLKEPISEGASYKNPIKKMLNSEKNYVLRVLNASSELAFLPAIKTFDFLKRKLEKKPNEDASYDGNQRIEEFSKNDIAEMQTAYEKLKGTQAYKIAGVIVKPINLVNKLNGNIEDRIENPVIQMPFKTMNEGGSVIEEGLRAMYAIALLPAYHKDAK